MVKCALVFALLIPTLLAHRHPQHQEVSGLVAHPPDTQPAHARPHGGHQSRKGRVTIASIEPEAKKLAAAFRWQLHRSGFGPRITVSAVQSELQKSLPDVLVVFVKDDTPRADQAGEALSGLIESMASGRQSVDFGILLLIGDTGNTSTEVQSALETMRHRLSRTMSATSIEIAKVGFENNKPTQGALEAVCSRLELLLIHQGLRRRTNATFDPAAKDLTLGETKSALQQQTLPHPPKQGQDLQISPVGFILLTVAPLGLYAVIKWHMREEKLFQRHQLSQRMMSEC